MTRPARREALSDRLADNRARLKDVLGAMADVAWRDLLLPDGGGRPRRGLLVYLEEMVESRRLEDGVLRPLLADGVGLLTRAGAGQARLPVSRISGASTVGQVIRHVLRGEAALLVDGHAEAFIVDAKEPPARPVEEPTVETSIHGAREAFSPLLERNMGLLRRRLTTPGLRLERMEVGSLSRTTVVIAYVEGKAAGELVQRVRRSLEQLDPEVMLDTEELMTALAGRSVMVLPTVLVTERPDITARYLVSGRVAVLADNSPRALILPGLLIDHLSAVDDFYELRPFVLLVRTVRMLALAISVFLPSLYVAIITFHLQALPTLLTLSLLAQREGAPLPTPVEAVLMVVTFEILREAGLRLPRPVGPSVSIVGGLVIGEAAMRAGVTSPAMVLVVSATAISTFAIPSPILANVATVFRIGLLILSSVFGFFGLLIGYVVLAAYTAGLTSGEVPWATPIMPLHPGYLRDAYGLMPRPPYGPGPAEDPTLVLPPGRHDRRQK